MQPASRHRIAQLAVVHTTLSAAIAAVRLITSEWAGELPARAIIDSLGFYTALAAPGFVVSLGFRSSAARIGAAAVGMPISAVLGSMFGLPSVVLFGVILRTELRNRPPSGSVPSSAKSQAAVPHTRVASVGAVWRVGDTGSSATVVSGGEVLGGSVVGAVVSAVAAPQAASHKIRAAATVSLDMTGRMASPPFRCTPTGLPKRLRRPGP